MNVTLLLLIVVIALLIFPANVVLTTAVIALLIAMGPVGWVAAAIAGVVWLLEHQYIIINT